jgi:polygalacturonase
MRSNIYTTISLLFFALHCLTSCHNPSPDLTFDQQRDAILAQIVAPVYPAEKVLITDFGAVGDSLTDCKPAFDTALLKAKESPGGLHIVVPAGIYLINGPLHLVSGVCLDLQEGARLKFSGEPAHFLPVVKTSWEGTFLYNYSPMIYAYGAENVIITGKGNIDGNSATSFSTWRPLQKEDQMLSRKMNHESVPVEERIFGEGHFLRPHLIQFFECKNILIEGVHITNAPFWCVHLLKSENITVRGISFNAKNVNNDGIDPEYSRNVLIENVDFDNGDDNVAIKAGRDYEGRATAIPTENIVIRNNRFKGLHAVVIGSEMSAGVQNVFVENNTFAGYCKRGIYMKSNPDRGGFMRNIHVRNLELDEVEDLFYITSFYHGQGEGFTTKIENISIENVRCRKARKGGIVIQGFPTEKVRNISFHNISIDSAAIGISVNHVENITFSDVNIGGKVMEMPGFAH